MKMFAINVKIQETISKIGIKSRPNASPSWGVSFLLPISILIAYRNNPEILTGNYKLTTISAFGVLLSNILLLTQCVKHKNFNLGIIHYVCAIFISFLFHTCLHRGLLFSVYSGLFSTIMYHKSLLWVLKTFPQSFTFGEAALAAQGLIIFVYAASVNIFNSVSHTPTRVNQISTLILQVGIIGLGIISYLTYKRKFFQAAIPFYGLTIFIFTFFILIPLHILLKRSAVLFIFELLTKSNRTIYVILFWIVCTAFATITLHNQIRKGRKANTVIRKTFHILAFIVFLTGLIDQCSILYLASGIILVLFFALEILRNLNLPPLGEYLQDGFVVLCDEKDAGSIALTPIYLLVGCALPLWIHPASCDVTDSAGFNLLPLISGILSTGIGDSFASAVGTWIGKHKWPRSKKTFEGTIACILSQFAFVYLLIYSGYIINNRINIVKTVIAVVLTSFVEAQTDQIDNVILPLISYIVLY